MLKAFHKMLFVGSVTLNILIAMAVVGFFVKYQLSKKSAADIVMDLSSSCGMHSSNEIEMKPIISANRCSLYLEGAHDICGFLLLDENKDTACYVNDDFAVVDSCRDSFCLFFRERSVVLKDKLLGKNYEYKW